MGGDGGGGDGGGGDGGGGISVNKGSEAARQASNTPGMIGDEMEERRSRGGGVSSGGGVSTDVDVHVISWTATRL